MSPPPESQAARIRVGDVDVKIGKPFVAKLRGWIVPILVTAGLSLAGVLVGYYQGLKAAGMRVRALEARVEALSGEVESLRASHDARLRSLSESLAREGVLTSDHDARLPKVELRLERLEVRVQDLARQKAIVVKP